MVLLETAMLACILFNSLVIGNSSKNTGSRFIKRLVTYSSLIVLVSSYSRLCASFDTSTSVSVSYERMCFIYRVIAFLVCLLHLASSANLSLLSPSNFVSMSKLTDPCYYFYDFLFYFSLRLNLMRDVVRG